MAKNNWVAWIAIVALILAIVAVVISVKNNYITGDVVKVGGKKVYTVQEVNNLLEEIIKDYSRVLGRVQLQELDRTNYATCEELADAYGGIAVSQDVYIVYNYPAEAFGGNHVLTISNTDVSTDLCGDRDKSECIAELNEVLEGTFGMENAKPNSFLIICSIISISRDASKGVAKPAATKQFPFK